jgi:hypothetical protein
MDAAPGPSSAIPSGPALRSPARAASPRERIWDTGARPAIPPMRSDAPVACPDWVFTNRRLVENLWARLKEWRAVAARYEKTARSFLGVLCLPATVDRLRIAKLGQTLRCHDHIRALFGHAPGRGHSPPGSAAAPPPARRCGARRRMAGAPPAPPGSSARPAPARRPFTSVLCGWRDGWRDGWRGLSWRGFGGRPERRCVGPARADTAAGSGGGGFQPRHWRPARMGWRLAAVPQAPPLGPALSPAGESVPASPRCRQRPASIPTPT